jgi:Rieske Fe-S protein
MSTVDRRTVLRGACAGCAGLALAACGGGSSTTGQPESSTAASSAAAPGGPLATLADIPVGTAVAAKSPDGQKLLVTRTGEATAVAFSSACTHQGCTVEPDGTKLACPCHGSVYDAQTAKVLSGPAPRPLRSVPVVVRDGGVFLA